MDQQPLTPQQPTQPQPIDPNLPSASSPQPEQVPVQSVPSSEPTAAPAPQIFGLQNSPTPPSGEVGAPVLSANSATVMQASKPRRKLKAALLTLVGLVVIGGGSAAAYFGIVVPNKPENVLKTAVFNSFDQQNISAKVLAEGKSGGAGFKADMTMKANVADKSSAMDAKFTVSGLTFSGEARMVGGSAFMKVGDLSNVTSLIEAFSPDYATQIKAVTDKVSDQWFEIDSTILKTAGADCVLNTETKLSEADLKILSDKYTENPFVTIKNTSNEDISGKAAIKYDLSINNKKAAQFLTSLEQTSLFKKLDSCAKQSETTSLTGDQDISNTVNTDGIKDTDNTELTVWVDKSTKQFSKVAYEASAEMKKNGNDLKIEATMDYAPVKIDKPEGSMPITDLIAELGKAFNGQPVLGAKIEDLLP